MLMIRPPLRRIATAFCVTVNVPMRLTRMTLSNSSTDIFLMVRSLMIPELFTRISSPPCRSWICFIMASHCAPCFPNALIISAPIPRELPVTSTTLPAKSNASGIIGKKINQETRKPRKNRNRVRGFRRSEKDYFVQNLCKSAKSVDKLFRHERDLKTMASPIRILTAVPICDGHDSAINTVNLEFIRHGIEVIYLGYHRSVGDIVRAAIQEDVRAIGISSYNSGHIEFFAAVVDLLRRSGADDINVFGGGGGTITHDDVIAMRGTGVDQIFFAGTSLSEMADY